LGPLSCGNVGPCERLAREQLPSASV
jgi:hypothetical protein